MRGFDREEEMLDGIQIMGDSADIRTAVHEYIDAGVDVPIVFPCPWGQDRAATVRATMEAAVS